MDKPPITFRRSHGKWVVDPPGWEIDGVIGPVERRWWERPLMLFCSRSGIVVARRTYRGFCAAGVAAGRSMPVRIEPDQLWLATIDAISFESSYTRGQIAAVVLRRRQTKNEVRLVLRDDTRVRFFLFARAATEHYGNLLRRLFEDKYQEESFRAWWDIR
jgi:hypothetical protein